tara:strand:+ start:40 stop:552 length:513 start_codon:yes stop_codon:yes gene_type:complete
LITYTTLNFAPLPTPPQLFRQFERGDISREELHATLALHARCLIGEMVEAQENPKTSYLERLRNFATARKLTRKHGRIRIREILSVMGEIEGFPPAQILWNASHTDVPLHCFFRTKIEPVFRITQLEVEPMEVKIEVEYGAHHKKKTTRESIVLQRDAKLQLVLLERAPL